MVQRVTRFRCEKCRRSFRDYEEARDCELDHITADAIASVSAKIEAAFKPAPTQEPKS